jgi:hypothetical protein
MYSLVQLGMVCYVRSVFHMLASCTIFHVFCHCLSASVILLNKGNSTRAPCPFSYWEFAFTHNEHNWKRTLILKCTTKWISLDKGFLFRLLSKRNFFQYVNVIELSKLIFPCNSSPFLLRSSWNNEANLTTHISHLQVYLPTYLWLYSPLLGHGRFFQFPDLFK